MRLLYKTGPMESLRKWFYKPKRDDRSLLAQFFFADDALNMVATELDSFDGRKDPERCSTLVNQLRHAQDRVLNITSQIMDQLLGDERVARGFRVKFPEDVLQDNLAGQLWFGAECLAAGSSIMNREEESAAMRPLAKALTRSLKTVRSLLREQCLRPRGLALSQNDDMLQESLRIFDGLFAEFELCYVSAMVNVKTPHEFESQQLICVLFSESLRRALRQNLLTQEQVDSYDPALMFAVPRLAIVSGLLIYSSGPLSIDKPPEDMSDMFRPFRTLLHKIRSLLWTLDRRELMALERLLCTNEDVSNLAGLDLPLPSEPMNESSCPYPDIGEFVSRFYADHASCRDIYTQQSPSEQLISECDYLPDNIEVMTPIIDGLRRLSADGSPEPECEGGGGGRKPSRDGSELAALRNLSTSGLMMFDPLVINAAAELRRRPDPELVSSLHEQVDDPAADGDLPSTSHGYLIPNAIGHEPAVLSSLSHNNSAVFNQDDVADQHNTNPDLPLIIPDNIHSDIVNTNISIANANLTSLLLTNEEYRHNFIENNEDGDNTSFHSAKMTTDKEESVKFMLGYESEHESPVDSGVSTENTSLDRSPDTENKDIKENHYMQQNRVLKSPESDEDFKDNKNTLESSFSDVNTENTVNINYTENDTQKNEAGSSIDNVINRLSSEENEETDETKRVQQDWEVNARTEDLRSIEEVNVPSVVAGQSSADSRHKKMRKAGSKSKRKRAKIWSPGNVVLDSRPRQSVNSPLRLNLDQFVDESGGSACADDEQIAVALQAQELAARQQARGKFKSSEDLIHRLFVCIAGVADQLQTNFAADLRNILKSVFLMNQTPDAPDPLPDKSEEESAPIEYEAAEDQVIQNGSSFDSVYSAEEVYADSTSDSTPSESAPPAPSPSRDSPPALASRDSPSGPEPGDSRRKDLQPSVSTGDLTYSESRSKEATDRASAGSSVERAPEWVPDVATAVCMRCAAHFTAFRRRHHCRNCGNVFCSSCSSNSIPLPRYGQIKPVRVCDECFVDVASSCRRPAHH